MTAATPITKQQEPKWLQFARTELGVREGAGAANNPVILSWAAELGGWIAKYFKEDSIPWCGLFADLCLTETGFHTPGDQSLGALNWRGWGQALTKAVPGAVLVFERLGGGHVGFYVGECADSYFVLGGNQSDSVCIERIAKTRCVAIRWPYEVLPYGQPLQLNPSGTPLSTNEA